jgi:hypothetical protein
MQKLLHDFITDRHRIVSSASSMHSTTSQYPLMYTHIFTLILISKFTIKNVYNFIILPPQKSAVLRQFYPCYFNYINNECIHMICHLYMDEGTCNFGSSYGETQNH